MNNSKFVEGLSEQSAKEKLLLLLDILDELNDEDFFGTDGWKNFFDVEDKF